VLKQQHCRAQLTADDFAFVVKVLAAAPKDAVSLVSLLSDEDMRDQILDHDKLYAALLDDTGCLKISPALYFYILTRRVMRRAGLEERALSDYIAGMLVAFSHTKQLTETKGDEGRSFYYLSDLLLSLDQAPKDQHFPLRRFIGDYTLFFSGIFAERVQRQVNRRGAPGLGYYETIGQSCYGQAAKHPQARQSELKEIFEQLAEQFREVRQALNHLAENLLHGPVPSPVLIRIHPE
jgi:hypothetical protein